MTIVKYDVLREHEGDRSYSEGDLREADSTEVKHLVDLGLLAPHDPTRFPSVRSEGVAKAILGSRIANMQAQLDDHRAKAESQIAAFKASIESRRVAASDEIEKIDAELTARRSAAEKELSVINKDVAEKRDQLALIETRIAAAAVKPDGDTSGEKSEAKPLNKAEKAAANNKSNES